MTARFLITRAGPLTTVQDSGRFGMLRHGVSASGPMDRGAYALAGDLVGGGLGGIELTRAGIEIKVIDGGCRVGLAGGEFEAQHNGHRLNWPASVMLQKGDMLAVTPGIRGNYGYLRCDGDVKLSSVMGSIATSSRVGMGGLKGRALLAGDVIEIGSAQAVGGITSVASPEAPTGPVRVIWGLHAETFAPGIREKFLTVPFIVSSSMDRMGVRLDDPSGVFTAAPILSLTSDAVVAGDIQILGDGTPTVLMRDHQPTGGYPRIATVISADMDRFAQLRPGSEVTFVSVTLEHAHNLLRSASR